MCPQLLINICKYVKLSTEQKLFATFWTEKTLGKGDYLLRNGEVCRTDNFVVQGALKAFYINSENGKEEILYLAIDEWWATDIESFRKQKPSIYSIQAISDTILLQIRYNSFQDMSTQIPKLERFFRVILENYLGSLQRRIILNNVSDAEERYFHFLKKYSKIAEKVPQYLIASYLGISAEFLSRIRKKALLGAIGMSIAYIPGTIASMSGAKPEETGLASGLVNTSYQVGSALGLAIIVAISAAITNIEKTSGTTDRMALYSGFQTAFLAAAFISILAVITAALSIKTLNSK